MQRKRRRLRVQSRKDVYKRQGMRRAEFMKELEYLLQDIPDEEKEEALAYYRDYLEEAGDENERCV